MATHILVVDDQSHVRSTVGYLLEKEGFRVAKAASGTEALRLMEERAFDVGLIDLMMANMDGLELLRRVRARWPGVTMILMTAHASIPTAVDAMKNGAADYLVKPFDRDSLLAAIQAALAERASGHGSTDDSPFQALPGNSPSIRDAIDLARQAAATTRPVLLLGEFGSGRELLARAIHAAGPRASAPFVLVRCAAAGARVDAELFGSGPRRGRALEAGTGTLYLDEISVLPHDTQARLLRLLLDGEVVPEPGQPAQKCGARIVASIGADPDTLAAQGSLRHDLLIHLKALTIRMPALRDRRSDIPILVQHYARKHKSPGAPTPRFTRDSLRVLTAHPFPGNLRELEALVEQSARMAKGAEVTPEVLARLGVVATTPTRDAADVRTRLESEERRAILEALGRNPQDLGQTARELNISRTTLWRKMKKYGIET